MKKAILIIMGILLVTLVSAIPFGTLLTQDQVNHADSTIKNLDPSWRTNNNGNLLITNCRKDAPVCEANFLINQTLEKHDYNGTIYYEVVSKNETISFRTTKYRDIALNSSREEAFNQLMIDLKKRAIRRLRSEVNRLEQFKTQEANNEIFLIVENKNLPIIE